VSFEPSKSRPCLPVHLGKVSVHGDSTVYQCSRNLLSHVCVCFIQAPDLRDDMYLDALNSLLISGEYPPLFSVDELDSLLQVIYQRDNNIYHCLLIILKITVKSLEASSTLHRRNLKT